MLCLLLAVAARRSHAHPFSVSWAEMKVARDGITLTVKVMAEDYYLIHAGNLPGGKLIESTFLEARDKHRQYLLDAFALLLPDGRRLEGQFVTLEHDPFPPDGLPFGRMMAFVVTYTFYYKLDAPPDGLAFGQTIGGTDVLPSVVELTVQQEGFPWSKAMAVGKGRVLTLGFSWDGGKPSYLTEKPKPAHEGDGVADEFSAVESVYSFLYLDDFEVRHELLLPLYLLERFHEIPRAEFGLLTVAEQDAARPALEAFLKARLSATVNGLEVAPEIRQIQFLSTRFKDLAAIDARQDVVAPLTRVSVLLAYGAKSGLRALRLTWPHFDTKLTEVYTQVFEGEDVSAHRFTPKEPGFAWTAPEGREWARIVEVQTESPEPLRLPLIALAAAGLLALLGLVRLARRRGLPAALWLGVLAVCAAGCLPFAWLETPFAGGLGVRKPTDDEARAIFQTLHGNLYRAFDYRDEGEIYDALEKSVAGDLLATLYLQVHESLTIQEQGGARAKIVRVEVQNAAPNWPQPESDAFEVEASWTVDGSVEHWGHVHARANAYAARFRIEPREGRWKIVALQVGRQERVRDETYLRRPQAARKSEPAP